MAAEFAAAVDDLPGAMRQDDVTLAESARASLRRTVGRRLQKRPLVDVHLMRIAV